MEVFIVNHLYPISLNLENKLCIIIGGGNVARRRVSKLLEAQAIVKIISPTIHAGLETLIEENSTLSWTKAPYLGPEDLRQAVLVFATTDDPSLNKQIWDDAHSLGIFSNIASDGQLSDFIVPSSFNQGDLQISISTSGKVPGLSKAIKENLEESFGPEYEILVHLLEEIRNLAIAQSHNKAKNRHILRDITANYDSILEALNSGMNPHTVAEQLRNHLK